MKTLTSLLAGLLVLAAPASAQALVITQGCALANACTGTELLRGGSIRVNDKLFARWDFQVPSPDQPRSFDAELLLVAGSDLGGLESLLFRGTPFGVRLPPNPPPPIPGRDPPPVVVVADTNIFSASYVVSADAGFLIDGVTMEILEVGFVETDRGALEIGKNVRSAAAGFLASLGVVSSQVGPDRLADRQSFSPVASLQVFDRFVLDSVNTISVAQTFLQPAVGVPEPASLALLGIGLAGLGFARKKRTH